MIPMHEKPLPYWTDGAFYLPMGGPPDDNDPEFGEDALPAHPDDDFRCQQAPAPITLDNDGIPF